MTTKPIIGPPLLIKCINIAPWCVKFRNEILSMIKNGFNDAYKIIAVLKKKCHIK